MGTLPNLIPSGRQSGPQTDKPQISSHPGQPLGSILRREREISPSSLGQALGTAETSKKDTQSLVLVEASTHLRMRSITARGKIGGFRDRSCCVFMELRIPGRWGGGGRDSLCACFLGDPGFPSQELWGVLCLCSS